MNLVQLFRTPVSRTPAEIASVVGRTLNAVCFLRKNHSVATNCSISVLLLVAEHIASSIVLGLFVFQHAVQKNAELQDLQGRQQLQVYAVWLCVLNTIIVESTFADLRGFGRFSKWDVNADLVEFLDRLGQADSARKAGERLKAIGVHLPERKGHVDPDILSGCSTDAEVSADAANYAFPTSAKTLQQEIYRGFAAGWTSEHQWRQSLLQNLPNPVRTSDAVVPELCVNEYNDLPDGIEVNPATINTSITVARKSPRQWEEQKNKAGGNAGDLLLDEDPLFEEPAEATELGPRDDVQPGSAPAQPATTALPSGGAVLHTQSRHTVETACGQRIPLAAFCKAMLPADKASRSRAGRWIAQSWKNIDMPHAVPTAPLAKQHEAVSTKQPDPDPPTVDQDLEKRKRPEPGMFNKLNRGQIRAEEMHKATREQNKPKGIVPCGVTVNPHHISPQ